MLYKMINAYTQRFAFPFRGLKYFLKGLKKMGISDRRYLKKMPEGFLMYLCPAEHIQQQLFWYGYYEKELADLLPKLIKPGDTFLDIGANIGYFSLLMAKKEPTVTIVAFEPSTSVFKKLNEHILLNKFKNIITVNAAVGDKIGSGQLYLADRTNEGMNSLRAPENFSGNTENINMITIDSWFNSSGVENVNLVKIDVEGSELAVLKGMKNVIEKFSPMIIAEINPATLKLFSIVPGDIFQFMIALNYNLYIIHEDSIKKLQTDELIEKTLNVMFVHQSKKPDN